MIKKIVSYCPDDVRWAHYVPLRACLLAVRRKEVFLWIIKVVFQSDTRIEFERWTGGWADMESVVLGSGLEEKTFRDQTGLSQTTQEVFE